jgi:hypothetical protein
LLPDTELAGRDRTRPRSSLRPREVQTAIWFYIGAGILTCLGVLSTVIGLTSTTSTARGSVSVYGVLIGLTSEPVRVAIEIDVTFALLCGVLCLSITVPLRQARRWAPGVALTISIALAVANVAFGLRVNTVPMVVALVAGGILYMPVSRAFFTEAQR